MSYPQTIEISPPQRSDVEALLLEHPDVSEASLVSEEGPDGRFYPLAYVTPHVGRMREAKKRIYLADREKRIVQWKRAFDQVYRFGSESCAPSFVGWTSSYTNKPLPEIEMQEWLDCTTERILSYGPQKVLEIGCGVGLLVQNLGPKCSVYRGTDLSPVAVSRLREYVASRSDLSHVELFVGEATDLDQHAPGSIDTIVINSVIQYFPDIHYLQTVLESAARIVCEGGRIFVGDIRHLGLLPLFHGAVQLAKAPSKASARWLKQKVALAIAQDRELVIDPQFFRELRHSLPRISDVEILLKRGQAHNELTRYRYDVVLHIGETNSRTSRSRTSPCVIDWQAKEITPAELEARFTTQRLPSARIVNVSNRRLAHDLAAVRQIRSAADGCPVGSIQSLAPEVGLGADPEEFWKLADARSIDVRVSCSPNATDGSFDVELVGGSSSPAEPLPRKFEGVGLTSHGRRLATDPLEVTFLQQLGLELEQLLSSRLPASQVPAAVLAVNEIPREDGSRQVTQE